MNKTDVNPYLQSVCNIAIEAGLIINSYYKLNTEVTFKEDRTPLTEADLASNKFIINSLSELSLDIPILSEESLVEWDVRKNWSRYWLVDPLDGTKEFVEGIPNFVISIGLVQNGTPVLGTIYNPVTKELFTAYKNNGIKLNGLEYKISIEDQFNNVFSKAL